MLSFELIRHQALPQLDSNKVHEVLDARLNGEYPLEAVKKVNNLFIDKFIAFDFMIMMLCFINRWLKLLNRALEMKDIIVERWIKLYKILSCALAKPNQLRLRLHLILHESRGAEDRRHPK